MVQKGLKVILCQCQPIYMQPDKVRSLFSRIMEYMSFEREWQTDWALKGTIF